MQLHVFLLLLMITEVQEVVTNSSEQRSSPESEQGFSTTTAAWSEPGVSDTIRASPKAARGMEEGESLPSSEPVGVDVPGPGVDISLRGRGQPQTPAGPGLAVAGGTDRNTPPLPQEARDNRVDMSGAARVTQGHGSPKENTHKYTHTQPTSTADTPSVAVLNMSAATHSGSPHVLQRDALPRTGKVNTVGYNTVTDTQPATDTNTSTQSVKYTDIHTNIHTTQIPLALSRSRAPSPPSSLPRSLPTSGAPNRPLQTGALLTPRGGYVGGGPGESQTPAWRTQRSADELRSGRTLWPARREDSGSTDAELVTAATPFTQRPVTTDPSQSMDSSERDSATQAMSSHPDVGQTSAPVYLHYDTTSRPPESKVTDGLGGGDMLHATSPHLSPAPARTQTDDPQGRPTGALAPSLSPVSQNDNNFTDVSSRHISSASSSPKESPGSASSERSPEVTRAPVWTTRPPRSPPSDTAALPGTVASTIFSDDAMKTDSENDADGEVTQPGADVSACALCPAESSSTAALPHPHTSLPTGSFTPTPLRPTVDDVDASRDRDRFQTQSTAPTALQPTDRLLTSYTTSATTHVILTEHKTTLAHLPTPPKTQTPASSHAPQTSPSSAEVSPTCDRFRDYMTTTQTALLSQTPSRPELGPGVDGRAGEGEPGRSVVTATPSRSFLSPPTARPSPAAPVPGAEPHPGQDSPVAGASPAPPGTDWGPTTTTQKPRFYIVPDRPATIRVDSIELLLQIVVDEYSSAFTSGLEIYTSAWVRPFLQKAPGYSRLLRVWSRGFVVQSLVEFKTRAALDWLGKGGPDSLLEHTGLVHAVREEWRFKGSRITNVTVGGLQGEVCDWLLQCPAGYACVFQPGAVNHSCSSVCNYDYCHHHGICTHHPDQLPVCRCLAGQDFWFMGQRCDVKMTRARLVGACLAILVIVVTLIAVMALVAVRRYRAILIKAKVDQTRSSYRRFNHFDELSGRFWQRSAAASADSLDNPAFTRSDELLHLRALDRTCCYHDDTLSLASTCPSNGTHLNTVFPHSSQYGWRGSEGSLAECVLDSGKASDLSVCSWPVEPIQWTPFPLLQQLASHRTNAVTPSRTRSYCEGMELVDLGKSWTA